MSEATNPTQDPLLTVRGLEVEFAGREPVRAVRGVDLDVFGGESLAIVGESGSGKSVTARSLLRLVRSPGRITGGTIDYAGRDVLAMSERELAAYRGGEVAMVSQDPLSSLNPVMTIGDQIAEAVRVHGRSRKQARARAAELLELVDVPDPARRLADYPHHFSGGMRQRVMIAMALANDPSIVVADEPTTALDVTVQAQVLDIFARLNSELGTAVVVITHNLGLVARLCDRVVVMYGGRVVEQADVAHLHDRPRHPYSAGLLRSVPRIGSAGGGRLPAIEGRPPDPRLLPPGCAFAPRCALAEDRCRAGTPPLTEQAPGHLAACWVTGDGLRLVAKDVPAPAGERAGPRVSEVDAVRLSGVHKNFPAGRRRVVRAVRGADLVVRAGETVGLVGESGCGKSTLARLVLGLDKPDSGTVTVRGGDKTTDLAATTGRELTRLRRHVQLVFQDPYASLNPRHRIGEVIAEPLRIHRMVPPRRVGERVAELLALVGLDASMASRLPRDFSGGQRQRIALARALAVEPALLVLDEPVSALDVSLQAQIVNLLADLKERLGISYLFVAHDIAVVRHVSDRIAVMYLGQVVEQGPADEVCARPLHPYTAALLSAVPDPDPAVERARTRIVLHGEVPSPLDPPPGCAFHTRCPLARAICRTERPEPREVEPGRFSACHFAEETGSLVADPVPVPGKQAG
jgi:peptide/nickel transport system ATP-binding protein